jgi:hypothetical protein
VIYALMEIFGVGGLEGGDDLETEVRG